MSHTVGAHSDDRGGESDLPCNCQDGQATSQENNTHSLNKYVVSIHGDQVTFTDEIWAAVQVELDKAEKRGIKKAAKFRDFKQFTERGKPGRKRICKECGQVVPPS